MMSYSTRPSPQELRELSVPELAVIMLQASSGDLNANSLFRAHEQTHERNAEPDIQHLLERVSDAWAWLVAHGLIGPHANQDPASGWCRITERGRQVAAEGAPTAVLAEQRLPDDVHERLREARRQFRSGNPEISVFEAMKQVEVRLRELSQAGDDLIGVRLARQALDPEKGPLADSRLEKGEREAVAHLFAGALGAFKNPPSHRIVNFDDPALAADAVLLADLLMRMLDRGQQGQKREARSAGSS